jgi:Na+/phosphate symporter
MKEETLIRYLEFLKIESKRHQNDKIITDDELNQLEIEIRKFMIRVETASLSKELKNEIKNIDFNLDAENHNKPKYNWLNFIGGKQGREIKNQLNRKSRFEKLYNDTDAALFKIKYLTSS